MYFKLPIIHEECVTTVLRYIRCVLAHRNAKNKPQNYRVRTIRQQRKTGNNFCACIHYDYNVPTCVFKCKCACVCVRVCVRAAAE